MASESGFGSIAICIRAATPIVTISVTEMRLTREQQALHELPSEQMPFDDLCHVVDGDVTVPDLFRIHDDRDSMRALIEAAGVVGSNQFQYFSILKLCLESIAHLGPTPSFAAALGIISTSRVDTDEDMTLQAGHAAWILTFVSRSAPHSASFAL